MSKGCHDKLKDLPLYFKYAWRKYMDVAHFYD